MTGDELKFRRKLFESMEPMWLATIHVESHLNPGVPDCSFVMRHGDCETGWLELKVSRSVDPVRVHVEPGQHRWMREHASRVPACFLIASPTSMYLVDGKYHDHLAIALAHDDLAHMAIWWGDVDDWRPHVVASLKHITDRSRIRGK